MTVQNSKNTPSISASSHINSPDVMQLALGYLSHQNLTAAARTCKAWAREAQSRQVRRNATLERMSERMRGQKLQAEGNIVFENHCLPSSPEICHLTCVSATAKEICLLVQGQIHLICRSDSGWRRERDNKLTFYPKVWTMHVDGNAWLYDSDVSSPLFDNPNVPAMQLRLNPTAAYTCLKEVKACAQRAPGLHESTYKQATVISRYGISKYADEPRGGISEKAAESMKKRREPVAIHMFGTRVVFSRNFGHGSLVFNLKEPSRPPFSLQDVRWHDLFSNRTHLIAIETIQTARGRHRSEVKKLKAFAFEAQREMESEAEKLQPEIPKVAWSYNLTSKERVAAVNNKWVLLVSDRADTPKYCWKVLSANSGVEKAHWETDHTAHLLRLTSASRFAWLYEDLVFTTTELGHLDVRHIVTSDHTKWKFDEETRKEGVRVEDVFLTEDKLWMACVKLNEVGSFYFRYLKSYPL